MICRECEKPLTNHKRYRCRKCERAQYSEDYRIGVCASCGGETSDKRAKNCRDCAEELSREPKPLSPEEESKLARVDARLAANGRCGTCHLWLPCGGHLSAAYYATLSREVVDG